MKLSFQPDRVKEFVKLFTEEKKKIAAFDGCLRVELWEDTETENVFFTYSEWRDKHALENYRNSDFFRQTWAQTKTFFAAQPQAWSLNAVSV